MNQIESLAAPAHADCNAHVSHWHHCAIRTTAARQHQQQQHQQQQQLRLPDDALKAVLDKTSISFVFHQKSHEPSAAAAKCLQTNTAAGGDGDGEDEIEN